MNRVELKENAKKMIVGKKWYLLKPIVLFELIMCAILFVIGFILGMAGLKDAQLTNAVSIAGSILSIIEIPFMIGYAKYCIEFVRGNNTMDWKDPIKFGFSNIITCILVSILTGLIVLGGTILLVIPGIIFAVALTFYQEVCADEPELGAVAIVKKAWNMTKGHRMDLFVIGLSFIGWALLVPFTFGILLIWLYPYMTITMILAYEELRKAA